jgi:tryptophan synthase alpha chain
MSRIQNKFKELKKKKKKALIVFMTAGDPSIQRNEQMIYALEKEGVDLIELGVPFSDPLADGPVIQASSMRALNKKTNLVKILSLVKKIRLKSQVPILLMTYLNPIMRFGFEKFSKEAKAAGVDGMVIPDLPPDEGKALAAILRKNGVDLVYLLAPTSDGVRRKIVCSASRGFIYYVSMTGVTGGKQMPGKEVHDSMKQIKKMTALPVCVGFGVSQPEQAKELSKTADGVIIGSYLVKELAANPRMSAQSFSEKFVQPFVKAIKG